MAWIEFHQPLVTHRKLYALAALLKVRRSVAAGHLAFLWCWALDNAPSGDITGIDPEVIKLAADWPKNADAFIQSLISAGFVDASHERRTLHDWDDYAGRLVRKRAANAQRMKDARAAHVQGLPPPSPPHNRTTTTTTTSEPLPATDDPVVLCVRALDNLVGSLTGTPTVSRQIQEWLDAFAVVGADPVAWFTAACDEAARQNVRKLSYVLGILDRWQREGFRADNRPKPNGATDDPYAEQQRELSEKAKRTA